MSELGPVSRSLLAAAREGLGPDAGAAARVRARLAATIGGAAVGVAATPAPSIASGAATAAGSGVIAKLAVVLALAGAVAGGVVVASSRAEAPSAPRLVLAPEPEQPARERVRIVLSDHADLAVAPAVVRPAPSHAGARPVAHPVATPVAPPVAPEIELDPPAVVEAPSLAREVELLDAAMAALRGGDPARALATLATFERETGGHGQMAEDAAAIAIEARCARHEDVRAARDAFDRDWPSSAQGARLASACARR